MKWFVRLSASILGFQAREGRGGVALPPDIDEQALGKMYLDALQEQLPSLTSQAARHVSDLAHFLHHRHSCTIAPIAAH
eukprot:4425216-Amphidinium_carterae.1